MQSFLPYANLQMYSFIIIFTNALLEGTLFACFLNLFGPTFFRICCEMCWFISFFSLVSYLLHLFLPDWSSISSSGGSASWKLINLILSVWLSYLFVLELCLRTSAKLTSPICVLYFCIISSIFMYFLASMRFCSFILYFRDSFGIWIRFIISQMKNILYNTNSHKISHENKL